VSQSGPLAVATEARCLHRISPTNRRSLQGRAREEVVRRYWFVDKNLPSPLCRLAFWWSMLGRLLILLLSTNPDARTALSGFLRGLRRVWTRDHELLRPD
jgi:GT2 family glycosyltransferase